MQGLSRSGIAGFWCFNWPYNSLHLKINKRPLKVNQCCNKALKIFIIVNLKMKLTALAKIPDSLKKFSIFVATLRNKWTNSKSRWMSKLELNSSNKQDVSSARWLRLTNFHFSKFHMTQGPRWRARRRRRRILVRMSWLTWLTDSLVIKHHGESLSYIHRLLVILATYITNTRWIRTTWQKMKESFPIW